MLIYDGVIYGDIFKMFWGLAISLLNAISSIWGWLITPISLGFDLPIIGYVGIPPFTPFFVIGVGFTTILLLWLIKALVPFL